MGKAFGWRPGTPTPPLRHAGNSPVAPSAVVLTSVTFRLNARYPAMCRLSSRLSPGQRHGFPHWHFQSFAQCGEICITWPNPTAFPVINRHLRDSQTIRELGDSETFDLPCLADLLT